MPPEWLADRGEQHFVEQLLGAAIIIVQEFGFEAPDTSPVSPGARGGALDHDERRLA